MKEYWMSGNQALAYRYQEVAINTANPLQLVVMLYDAAICSIKEAREHVDRKDIAGRSRAINKFNAIVTELQSCLNMKAGGEIAGSLNRLYDYMKRRSFSANVEQSSQPLAEIESLLENLRSAWSELVAQNPGTENQAAKPPLKNQAFAPVAPPKSTQLKSLNISI
jgi:flagellar secretion chaperone FliS